MGLDDFAFITNLVLTASSELGENERRALDFARHLILVSLRRAFTESQISRNPLKAYVPITELYSLTRGICNQDRVYGLIAGMEKTDGVYLSCRGTKVKLRRSGANKLGLAA